MKKEMNKKAFEIIWNTWVVMILAFIVLVFLVLFFTNAGKGFLDNAKAYFSSNNVDAITKGCNILDGSGQDYNFCCDKKEVKYLDNGKKSTGLFSCGELMNKDFINNKIISNIKCEGVSC